MMKSSPYAGHARRDPSRILNLDSDFRTERPFFGFSVRKFPIFALIFIRAANGRKARDLTISDLLAKTGARDGRKLSKAKHFQAGNAVSVATATKILPPSGFSRRREHKLSIG